MTTAHVATTSWPHLENDPQRIAVLAAADRLLAGTPDRSTGNLSVAQLAVEADVKYWVVAQKHPDLRDHFQRLTAQRRQDARAAPDRTRDACARLQRDHRELKLHCARLEALVQTYAVVINELTLENNAIRERGDQGSVTPLPAQRATRR